MKLLVRRGEVEWIDAMHITDGWITLDAAVQANPKTCSTRGFILKETEYAYTLASTIDKKWGYALGVLCIPKCCIIKFTLEGEEEIDISED